MGYLDKLKAKADSNAAGELKMLPLSALEPSARNFYRMCEIDQLADSIAANGLEQNLVVKAEPGGKYRIITGHRRYQALLRLMSRGVRVDTVPCIVRPAETDAQEMLRMIASNQYRELSDYEKMLQVEAAADAVKTLRSTKVKELGGIRLDGPTREVISRLTGMSGPAVSKYAGIAEKLVPKLKAKMKQGLLPFTVAYEACQYPAEWQKDMADGTGAVSLKDVQEVAVKRAVREALFSDLSDELDATASSSENTNRVMAVCDGRTFTIPGGGRVQGFVGGTMFIGRGNVNWMVEVMAWKLCEVADSAYKSMMTGTWKQEEEREKFKALSKEALDMMDGELEELLEDGEKQTAGRRAAEKELSPSPAGDTSPAAAEEARRGVEDAAPYSGDAGVQATAGEEAVESGRFGRLRDELSGKGAAPDDKAWDQLIVWNREKPPEDVYAVVHTALEGMAFEQLAYYSCYRDRWYMDQKHRHALAAQVIGWFKIPKWED
nr:MAG TPA: chromosome partitioning protein [Caudoviricetes sp.]